MILEEGMPGGIRPRLARLIDPDMKRFVSDAVSQANDPAGKKLLADLNKHWTTALKAKKEYDKLVAIAEKGVQKMQRNTSDLDDAAFAEMQSMISFLNKELKPIAAAVSAFEKTEDALVKKYNGLRRVPAA
jgi:uncharacterized protein YecA (UPF0149 family)